MDTTTAAITAALAERTESFISYRAAATAFDAAHMGGRATARLSKALDRAESDLKFVTADLERAVRGANPTATEAEIMTISRALTVAEDVAA